MTSYNTTGLQDTIHKAADRLAGRYGNKQMFNDLRQEALLKAYELMADGVTDEKKIIGSMRSRLRDFYNFEQLPVTLPASGHTRKARVSLMSGKGSPDIEWPLLQALMASGEVLNDNLPAISNHVEEYEFNDYLQHLMFIMEEALDTREYEIIVCLYLNGDTQDAVATEMGITQQRVEKIKEVALMKVREAISVPDM
jgi:RNA polymerase sigma factor (sigma-70 family)